MRGATPSGIWVKVAIHGFQSTRPMRGATSDMCHKNNILTISIHAPHAGRDIKRLVRLGLEAEFQSTRPMRGATSGLQRQALFSIFQSTRPMRGATTRGGAAQEVNKIFQSTRPMRGATGTNCRSAPQRVISIHAPHAGRDTSPFSSSSSTLISIHAPHAGRDFVTTILLYSLFQYFNPRAPCGARPGNAGKGIIHLCISIHAPHAGRDAIRAGAHSPQSGFQSTRPMRGATDM